MDTAIKQALFRRELMGREDEWLVFTAKVLTHITDYTIPQYGDKPDDQVDSWTAEDCILAMRKYLARFGRGSRVGEQKLDLIKIAHYAQIAYDKTEEFVISDNTPEEN